MTKIFSKLIFTFLKLLDSIFYSITKRSFLIYFYDFLQDNYKTQINILNQSISFFTPNYITRWRVNTFFTKEPETLEWIDSFEKKNNFIFWDIGSNIGLYSIYNAIKNPNSITISFEPSASNLKILSRNVYINNFQNKIKIFSLPLSNKENEFLKMKEGDLSDGSALNTVGENFDFEGKEFKAEIEYELMATNINYLLEKKILEVPDYIKIDVDGIEHLILDGANKYLKNKKIKSLSIEINENFKEQFNQVLKIMKDNEFKILHKKNNINVAEKFKNTFNYIFIR